MNVRNSKTQTSEKRTDKDLTRQWNSTDWKKIRSNVNRLQTRIAKATREGKINLVKRLKQDFHTSHTAARNTGCEMLERSAAKVARSVLRGLGVGNDPWLLDCSI
ncbi:MAG: reverse transcriptase N-terminal domain-containing protein [Methanosarcinaceae archaeon]